MSDAKVNRTFLEKQIAKLIALLNGFVFLLESQQSSALAQLLTWTNGGWSFQLIDFVFLTQIYFIIFINKWLIPRLRRNHSSIKYNQNKVSEENLKNSGMG